jgi:FkbH-like protein
VPFIRSLSSIIGSLYGRTCKCIALDLDNTLWGGVVGDDGVDGIRIGEGDAVSEAFKAFQQYLLGLRQRGILLAVCSKNEEANALAPFSQLPDMVLKRDDFVAFRANWDPKPDNLRAIASELNIGLDSLLFVDDNPAEREHIRQALPQVKVLELSDDPAEYTTLLDRCGWLEPARLTAEDMDKTGQYQKNTRRKALESEVVDYDSYLESLEQHAVIGAFDLNNLDRITQLINKTNQFNLTTQRLNRSEVETLMNDPDSITAYVRLADRFGDNGLISVLAGHREDGTFHIDHWLMSCRVFKRGVEYLLANHLFERLGATGIETVHGIHIPTAKNRIVENLYNDLGFTRVDTGDDGRTTWAINTRDYRPKRVFIELLEET